MLEPDGQFFFSILSGGLQDRSLIVPFASTERSWQIVYLRSGAIDLLPDQVETSREATRFSGPMIICTPYDPDIQIRLLAGSAGVHLAVNDLAMMNSLGSRPEAIELRLMVNSTVALPLQGLSELERRITVTLESIAVESQGPSPGKAVILEAQLRCLLILMWRECYQPSETISRDGVQTILLRRFRQLVETNFRNRWKVRDYANALNTTSDRLHSVTTSNLRRSPKDLITERTHREALALLMRSNLTLDQIAAYLGFKTTPQFSAHFRKIEGCPPGKYRASTFANQTVSLSEQQTRFDDWP